MTLKNLLPILFVMFCIPLHSQSGTSKECYLIMVGKKASADGSVYVAHNNDLTGNEASLVEITDTTVANDSLRFPSGLTVPAYKKNFRMMLLRIAAGFAEGDAVAINENMVSIGGGVGLDKDRGGLASTIDSIISSGLTGGIRYHVLRSARTAKECVQLLGEVFTKYGVSYPSGVAIADTSEIWYMENGGGKTWAAVRIPDWACMVAANGYRIGKINFEDKNNFLTSPGLLDFCKSNGLCDASAITINFAEIFGGGRKDSKYDSRRVWRGITLLNNSLNISPEEKNLPMFIRPMEKVTPDKLFSILRDGYEGTSYSEQNPEERTIASGKTVHSSLIVLNGKFPKEIGAVMWSGMSNPVHTVYIPFYYGITEVPFEYGISTEEYDARSAFWSFKDMSEKLEKLNSSLSKRIDEKLRTFENRIINSQHSIANKYLQFSAKDNSTARNFLTQYVKALVDNNLGLVKVITNELEKTSR